MLNCFRWALVYEYNEVLFLLGNGIMIAALCSFLSAVDHCKCRSLNTADPASTCRQYNKMGVGIQLETVNTLRNLEYRFLLPGHGRPGIFQSSQERLSFIDQLLQREHYSPPKALATA